MSENPFDACWDRMGRVAKHRGELAGVWNDFIADHPYDFHLRHDGGGVHVLVVEQLAPVPPDFALVFGEWLYNARACLDYIVWATAANVTGQLPPPDEGKLQYPIYDSPKAWKQNEYRLQHLAPHHRAMLLHMQPFNGDADANYLGVINNLARIDRHRRLTISTAYLANLEPVIQLPAELNASLQWGERVISDGEAQVARISISPWTDDTEVQINPQIGIDPEVAEWATSRFWGPVRFSERLIMIELFLKGEIATYEYDCTGATRMADALTDSFREECDRRGVFGPIRRADREHVAWSAPAEATVSTKARFEGTDHLSDVARPT